MPEQEPQNKQLTLEEAFGNVDQACAAFQGNRAQHVVLQQSLRMIGKLVAEELTPKDPEVENDECSEE